MRVIDKGCGRAVVFRVSEIALIPREHHGEIRRRQRARVHEERREAAKRGVRGDIVDEDRARRTAVVGPRNGPEPFRARRVPELQLDPFPAGTAANLDDFGREFDADGLRGQDSPWKNQRTRSG